MTGLRLSPNFLSSQHNDSSWLARVMWTTRNKTRQLFAFTRHEECARSENRNGSDGCWRVRCNLGHKCYESKIEGK